MPTPSPHTPYFPPSNPTPAPKFLHYDEQKAAFLEHKERLEQLQELHKRHFPPRIDRSNWQNEREATRKLALRPLGALSSIGVQDESNTAQQLSPRWPSHNSPPQFSVQPPPMPHPNPYSPELHQARSTSLAFTTLLTAHPHHRPIASTELSTSTPMDWNFTASSHAPTYSHAANPTSVVYDTTPNQPSLPYYNLFTPRPPMSATGWHDNNHIITPPYPNTPAYSYTTSGSDTIPSSRPPRRVPSSNNVGVDTGNASSPRPNITSYHYPRPGGPSQWDSSQDGRYQGDEQNRR